VRTDDRDKALRELVAALAIANLIALAVASLVGYRVAYAALDPVERYRAQTEEIAAEQPGCGSTSRHPLETSSPDSGRPSTGCSTRPSAPASGNGNSPTTPATSSVPRSARAPPRSTSRCGDHKRPPSTRQRCSDSSRHDQPALARRDAARPRCARKYHPERSRARQYRRKRRDPRRKTSSSPSASPAIATSRP